jgi:hypothetical protein
LKALGLWSKTERSLSVRVTLDLLEHTLISFPVLGDLMFNLLEYKVEIGLDDVAGVCHAGQHCQHSGGKEEVVVCTSPRGRSYQWPLFTCDDSFQARSRRLG